jgi:hypothetical protein
VFLQGGFIKVQGSSRLSLLPHPGPIAAIILYIFAPFRIKKSTFFALQFRFFPKQALQVVKEKMARRSVPVGALRRGKIEDATHDTVRETLSLHTGIDTDDARKMIKEIKQLKIKVQAQIMEDKIRVTGNKSDGKIYYRHSTYPGGVYETSFGKMQARFPGRALQLAVKGMLPKGPLGYAMIKKLKVYPQGEHPHSAQQPKPLNIGA